MKSLRLKSFLYIVLSICLIVFINNILIFGVGNENIILNVRDLEKNTSYKTDVILDDNLYEYGIQKTNEEGYFDIEIPEYSDYIILIVNDIVRYGGIEDENILKEKLQTFGFINLEENILKQNTESIIIEPLNSSAEYYVSVIADDELYNYGKYITSDEGSLNLEVVKYKNYRIIKVGDNIYYDGISESDAFSKVEEFSDEIKRNEILLQEEVIETEEETSSTEGLISVLSEIESETEIDISEETEGEIGVNLEVVGETETEFLEETEGELQVNLELLNETECIEETESETEYVEETEIETEFIEETETEIDEVVFEYKEEGLNIDGKLVADAEKQTFDGEIIIEPIFNSVGNVSADSVKNEYIIELPEGSIIPSMKVQDNCVVTESGIEVFRLLEQNTSAKIENVDIKNNVITVVVTDVTDQADAYSKEISLVFNSNSIGIELAEPLYRPSENNDDIAIETVYPNLEEDEYLTHDEILNVPFVDIEYEVLTEPNIKEGEELKVSSNLELYYDLELSEMKLINNTPISLKSFSDLEASDLGVDLGYITTQFASSVEFGSGFTSRGVVTMKGDGGSDVKYYYGNNIAYGDNNAVIYRSAAMYLGNKYDVKISYKKSESNMCAYALIKTPAPNTDRHVGDIANTLRNPLYDNNRNNVVYENNYTNGACRVDMKFEVLGLPAGANPTWIFECVDCDLEEGYWFTGERYYYKNTGIDALKEIIIIDTAQGGSGTAIVGKLGNAQYGNDPCKSFWALTTGGTFYATYRTKEVEVNQTNTTVLRKSDLNGASVNVRFGLTANSYNGGNIVATLFGNSASLSTIPVRLTEIASNARSTLPTLSVPDGYQATPWTRNSSAYAEPGYALGGTSDILRSDTDFYTEVQLKKGDLTVTKVIEDPSGFRSNAYNLFTFTLTGTGTAGITISQSLQLGQTWDWQTGTMGTCSNTTCKFLGIPVGTYTISESYSGYSGTITNVWDCSPSNSVNILEGPDNAYTFNNLYKTGHIKVQKTISNPAYDTWNQFEVSLEGWKFRLKGISEGGDSIDFTGTTNSSGIVTFSNIPVGSHYTITEISEPGRTTVDPNAWVVAPDKTNQVVNYTATTNITMHNIFKTGDLVVTKTIDNPAFNTWGNMFYKKYNGWVFLINGTAIHGDNVHLYSPTGVDGVAIFKNVPVGLNYTISEEKEPINDEIDGVNEAAWVKAANVTNQVITYLGTLRLTMNNKLKTGNIVVTKRIENPAYTTWNKYNKSIVGWGFELKGTSYSGDTVDLIVKTNSEGKAIFNNVPVGENYSITEISEPNSDSINRNVWDVPTIETGITLSYQANLSYTKTNIFKTGTIKVKKTIVNPVDSSDNFKVVKGWKFRIVGTSYSGESVDFTVETDDSGIATFNNLPVGIHYTISEVSEPGRNDVRSSIWDIPVNQSVDVTYLCDITKTMTNTYRSGNLLVKVTIENLAYDTYNPLFFKTKQGWVIRVQGISLSGETVNLTEITDENGIAHFNNIPIGNNYTVSEVSEPGSTFVSTQAWVKAVDQSVSPTYGTTKSVTMHNIYKTGNVHVKKTLSAPANSSAGNVGPMNLDGYKFWLSGTSYGNDVVNLPAVTNDAGNASWINVPVGHYIITEDLTVDIQGRPGVPRSSMWTNVTGSVEVDVVYTS